MEKVSCQSGRVRERNRKELTLVLVRPKAKALHISLVEFSAHWPFFHILDSCMCPGHDHYDGRQVGEAGVKLRAVWYHPCSQLPCGSLYPVRCWPPHHRAHCPSLPLFCLHPFLFLLLLSFMDQPPPFLLHSAPFCSPGFFLTTPCCLSPHHVHMSRHLLLLPVFPSSLSPSASSVPFYPTPCSGSSGNLVP